MSIDSHYTERIPSHILSLLEEQYWSQACEILSATPWMMDALWADGWRHFGTYFFRDMLDIVENQLSLILPLRINLDHCSLSKSQRRTLRKNNDLRVVFHEASVDEERRQLFDRHKLKFQTNRPESLRDFLSPIPSHVPCQAEECCVYEGDHLIAVSYVDTGDIALSSVYAIYDPSHASRRLGIFTLLQEMSHAQMLGKQYLYLGYAHAASSHYDYKKHFSGLEHYNWQGQWLPMTAHYLSCL